MATLAQLCLLLILFVVPLRGESSCDTVSCGAIDIEFPFGLNKSESRGCRRGYPRFEVWCDKRNRTLLRVAGSGDLVVKSINYEAQTVKVNDPEGCLPKRFLQNLSLSLHPPFTFDATLYDLTFLRCPSNSTVTKVHPLPPISCLRDSDSDSVIFSWWPLSDTSPWRDECEVISSAFVPIANPEATASLLVADLNDDVALKWHVPACGDCAGRGELCGFTGDTSLQVGCFPAATTPQKTQGLSRSAKYGLTIGVGIPGLLCLTGLCCFMCSKFDVYAHRHRAGPSNELPSSITTFPPLSFTMGLNGPEIEKLPKTLIGDSGRLPNSNDNTCPICLSEYEPKETLRTIPECNHYFHAHCIDEWLKMNATCPLCRNSPDPSSTVTPSSSSLSIYSPLP
ncbi:RING-H2 finger protein ATL20 [Cajanus cajan]|uniref:RING-type E3 ubiquitin transferase n=1 Tax=Cajanus cajan TaxID=3821 RepID=A0A151SCY1_CAJCA|nr:RING-H2 finger protein ATL20 [Cajanus cajan]KYP52628.1 RING-H2 finger protein ATL1E [Cajanus cajan]